MTVAFFLKAELLRSDWLIEKRDEIMITKMSKNKRELKQFTVMLNDRELDTENEKRERG